MSLSIDKLVAGERCCVEEVGVGEAVWGSGHCS